MTLRIIILLTAMFFIQSSVSSQSKLTPSFCEMLGMLSENSNRLEYEKDIVEIFYPEEKGLALEFLALSKQYEKEMKLNYGAYEFTNIDGFTNIYSKTLRDLINSFYVSDTSHNSTLDRSVILNSSNESKFAFIKGAYIRYGTKNVIKMAYAYDKINTLYLVMKSLKINDVKIYRIKGESPFLNDFILIFKPTDILKSKFNLTDSEYEIDLNDYIQIN